MKKLHLLLLSVTLCVFSACHNDIWDAIDGLDSRVTKLEELCKEMNTNITSLQTIVDVLQSNDFITSIVEIKKDGKVVGYTITFGKHDPITIYHGQDGKDGQNGTNGKDGQDGADGKDGQDGQNGADGKDGITPVIGVAQDADGVYYWTLNGEWLLDDNGNKLPVSGKDGQNGTNGSNGQDGADGKDGQDGEDGKDGADGQDGKDGITPQLKIEDGYWYISYDNGATWTQLGKATGENGQDGKDGADGEDGKDGQNGADGKDGQDGDSMFQSVTQDDNYVYFTLADGTVIKIAKGTSNDQPDGDAYIDFEDFNVLKALLNMGVDINNDCYIAYSEAANVDSLIFTNNTSIYLFREFKYFTGIKYFMFDKCSNLLAINLPEHIKYIENECFQSCGNLKNIYIPENCTQIGDRAFSKCSTLETVNVSTNCTSMGNSAFNSCTNLRSINIPENCIRIGDSIFNHCASLENIHIPESCSLIGAYAFNGCGSLQEISLPSTITRIEKYTFNNCSSLKKLDIPNSVYYIAANALTGLGVDTLTFPENYGSELIFDFKNPKLKTVVWNCIAFPTAYSQNNTGNNSTDYWGIGGYWQKENNSTFPPTMTTGNYNYITTIIFGEKVISLPSSLCFDMSSLKTIYSKNPIPPTYSSSTFTYTYSYVKNVYVPIESVEQYKVKWSDFADKIVGYDFE